MSKRKRHLPPHHFWKCENCGAKVVNNPGSVTGEKGMLFYRREKIVCHECAEIFDRPKKMAHDNEYKRCLTAHILGV